MSRCQNEDCPTLCPECGCCEHTPASVPCECPSCGCIEVGA